MIVSGGKSSLTQPIGRIYSLPIVYIPICNRYVHRCFSSVHSWERMLILAVSPIHGSSRLCSTRLWRITQSLWGVCGNAVPPPPHLCMHLPAIDCNSVVHRLHEDICHNKKQGLPILSNKTTQNRKYLGSDILIQ